MAYRITFLTVLPAPYQCELFDAVAAHPGLEPRVYYYTDKSPGSRWVVPPMPDYAEILPGLAIHSLTRCCCLNPSALRKLRSEPSDLVVVGDYFTLTAQFVMRDLTKRGVPWVFWGEIPGLNRRWMVGRALRRMAQRPILKAARGIVAIGSRAQTVYRQLLHDERPVFNIPYHCDLSNFLTIPRPRPDSAGSRGPVRFLFSGQLIPRKGVDVLLQAFIHLSSRFREEATAPRLVLLGDGDKRAEYEAMTPASLRSRVEFRGFCDPGDLPREFAANDVFVLPSRHDGWGVVVNEAIGAGMPVIASSAAGAAHDLIEPGQNGYLVSPGDVDDLASAMVCFALQPERVALFGRRSREIALNWTVERGAQRWHEVCEHVLRRADRTQSAFCAEAVPA